MTNELINTLDIKEIFNTYDQQQHYVLECLEKFKQARKNLTDNTTFFNGYADGLEVLGYQTDIKENDVLRKLNKSAWRFIYDKANIKHYAPNTHLKEFENMLNNPPNFTIEAIRDKFGDYIKDPRQMALQAFAEIFNNLDPFYKSHDNFRVGAKGLPKRIIIGTSWYHGWDRVADVVNVIVRFKNRADMCIDKYDIKKISESTEPYYMGMEFKLYKNGNVHIVFDNASLKVINDCLAEYYGEVLPDSYEHTEKPAQSKEVSKDLQFYRTPKKVAEMLIDGIYFRENDVILEPSCGDGALLDCIYEKTKDNFSLAGIEFDYSRYIECVKKGYNVYNDNFLTWKTAVEFNKIIGNPPFYGKHYFKHVEKAYELLADDGELHFILPITAIDHGLIDKYNPTITHLPVGSFKESGTNINTIIVKIKKCNKNI